MATYRYEITMMSVPGAEEFLRGLMPGFPNIARWKIYSSWRTVALAPSLNILTLASTGSTINKADLDNDHIAVANAIKTQYPAFRVIVTSVQSDVIIELT